MPSGSLVAPVRSLLRSAPMAGGGRWTSRLRDRRGAVRETRLALVSATVAAGFWGLSGTAAQALFTGYSFPVLGLVSIRMLGAGAILVVALRAERRPPFTPSFLALSILGIAASQLTYLEAIANSNAVTATLLQFLFLPMVAAYEALRGSIVWSARWSATLSLAGLGMFLLVANPTGASLGILVTPLGLLFGLLSAVAGAYYSLAGRALVQRHGSWAITGWGFLLGGAVTLPFGAATLLPYRLPSTLLASSGLVELVAFIVVFGTLLGYGLYLYGLRHLPATEVGVAASLEPIAAGVATYVLLGVALTGLQYAGGALILVAVALLGFRRVRPASPSAAPGPSKSP